MRTAAGLTGGPEELAWDLSGEDLYERVQSEVRARARKARGGDVPFTGHAPVAPAAGSTADGASTGRVALAVRRLPAFSRPPASSLRPGVSHLKRAVRRLISWEVDPVVHHEHLLQQAVVDSLDTLEQRLAALENAVAPPGASGNGDSTHASVDVAERG
jgi:hypothetical protein